MKASMICMKTEISDLGNIPPDSALIMLIAFAKSHCSFPYLQPDGRLLIL